MLASSIPLCLSRHMTRSVTQLLSGEIFAAALAAGRSRLLCPDVLCRGVERGVLPSHPSCCDGAGPCSRRPPRRRRPAAAGALRRQHGVACQPRGCRPQRRRSGCTAGTGRSRRSGCWQSLAPGGRRHCVWLRLRPGRLQRAAAVAAGRAAGRQVRDHPAGRRARSLLRPGASAAAALPGGPRRRPGLLLLLRALLLHARLLLQVLGRRADTAAAGACSRVRHASRSADRPDTGRRLLRRQL